MRSLLLAFAALIAFAACNDKQKPASADDPVKKAPAVTGCFFGHAGNTADTLELRLDAAANDQIRGDFRIALREKDQRIGNIHGLRGADGIYRTTFVFMQEGMTDSVQLQFRVASSEVPAIELRPSAYDPANGREYPDSTQSFSIRLNSRDCESGAAIQTSR